MQPAKQHHYFRWFSLLVACIIFTTTQHQAFFWDTIQLGSKQAWFFYEYNFTRWLLPDDIDSGHFPLFGAFLAFVWKILGKNLFFSHLAMLPVNFLLVLGICRCAAIFFKGKWLWVIIFLLLAEPALITQMHLMSPDVILMTSFVWVLWGIYTRNNLILVLSYIVLCLISLRGLMLGIGILSFFLYTFFFARQKKHNDYFFLKAAWPGLLLSFGYLLVHWYAKKWVGFHQNSPWAESFLWADLQQMFRNLLLILWRIGDHGRIIGIILILIVVGKYPKRFLEDAFFKKGIIFLGFMALPLLISGIVFSQLTAHRYYLPIYFLLIFGLGLMTYFSSLKTGIKKIIIGVSGVALLSGHFWKYPDHIAQGWDCMMTHRPYFSLHTKMSGYLDDNNISINEVATFFPSRAPGVFTHLNEETTSFLSWGDPDAVYVYLSSVHNDAPDDLRNKLKTIKPVWFEKEGLLYAGLYRVDDIISDK